MFKAQAVCETAPWCPLESSFHFCSTPTCYKFSQEVTGLYDEIRGDLIQDCEALNLNAFFNVMPASPSGALHSVFHEGLQVLVAFWCHSDFHSSDTLFSSSSLYWLHESQSYLPILYSQCLWNRSCSSLNIFGVLWIYSASLACGNSAVSLGWRTNR